MTLEEKIREVYESNGLINQIDQTIEEASELILALSKYKRFCINPNSLSEEYDVATNIENICEELADIQCMIWQMSIPFKDDFRDQRIEAKLDRILERLEKADNERNTF